MHIHFILSFCRIFSLCSSVFRTCLSLKWKRKGSSNELLGSVNLCGSFVLSVGELNWQVRTSVVLELQLHFKMVSGPCNIFSHCIWKTETL